MTRSGLVRQHSGPDDCRSLNYLGDADVPRLKCKSNTRRSKAGGYDMRDDGEDYLHNRIEPGSLRDRIKADALIISVFLGASLIWGCWS